jgi:hypothetical protein
MYKKTFFPAHNRNKEHICLFVCLFVCLFAKFSIELNNKQYIFLLTFLKENFIMNRIHEKIKLKSPPT